ncbi:thioredoxin domain-containing protein [Maricaulis sp.]|jgi:protein-disulfide isomerase|uniref:DsbA family protein n=1 Tax=Maricaulis sp. TaxID=1486257 RepID=UPI002638CD2B|nr:thioredoxin domain-containing protein [Maricaulis sp.]MDF1767371.1 thioredoxin domain-containing protein [Maricaulis sp.]
MHRLFAIFTASVALLGCQQPAASAQLTDPERDEVREVVREYILENPEIIEEALIELQRRARAREMQAVYDAVAANYDAIYNDPRDPRLGADDAEVVIVEFMDYKCSYCRVAASWVEDVRERYGDRVQVLFKEYPILGEDSTEAARAALAALRQGADVYAAFHMAMVNSSGPLPAARIDQLATVSGVNVAQMREDMADPAIMAHINQVRSLGRALNVTGTPFFIVDGVVVPGANEMALDQALAEALRG